MGCRKAPHPLACGAASGRAGLWPHGCSGRRRARPPARSPHASFARSGRSRSPPVPSGPSGALHTSGTWCADVCLCFASKPDQAPPSPINFARNSPATCSNIEFASLELQRFWGVSKNDHDKLRAKFVWRWCCCCPWAPQPGPAAPPAPSTPVGPGCLKPASPLLAGICVGLKPLSPLLACIRVGLKPPSPLRVPAEPRLKPPSPLRVRNGCF